MDFKVDQLLYKTHNLRSRFRNNNSVCMCGIELNHGNTAWQAENWTLLNVLYFVFESL